MTPTAGTPSSPGHRGLSTDAPVVTQPLGLSASRRRLGTSTQIVGFK